MTQAAKTDTGATGRVSIEISRSHSTDNETSNVVRLPTAARRKVINPMGLAFVGAASDLPRHPAKWEDRGGQRPYEEAWFGRSPEMLILGAIFQHLPDTIRLDVEAKLATLADMATFEAHAPTALHIVQTMNGRIAR